MCTRVRGAWLVGVARAHIYECAGVWRFGRHACVVCTRVYACTRVRCECAHGCALARTRACIHECARGWCMLACACAYVCMCSSMHWCVCCARVHVHVWLGCECCGVFGCIPLAEFRNSVLAHSHITLLPCVLTICCLLLQVLPRATSEELQQLIQGLLLLDVQVTPAAFESTCCRAVFLFLQSIDAECAHNIAQCLKVSPLVDVMPVNITLLPRHVHLCCAHACRLRLLLRPRQRTK
jgi:hypothetical protein